MTSLLEWFGNRPADSITASELEQNFAEQDWMPATYNRYRALLSLAYRLAIRSGKLRENPARLMSHRLEDNGRLRFLSPEEEKGLRAALQAAYPERVPEFDLALHTGMRCGEQYVNIWRGAWQG